MTRKPAKVYARILAEHPDGTGKVEIETTMDMVHQFFENLKVEGKEAFVFDSIGRVVGHQWCEMGIWKHYLEN